MDRQEAREALTGPFPSLSTPFHKDGSLDEAGLRDMVEFYVGAGSKTLLLTYGDSLHALQAGDRPSVLADDPVERRPRGRGTWATPTGNLHFTEHPSRRWTMDDRGWTRVHGPFPRIARSSKEPPYDRSR